MIPVAEYFRRRRLCRRPLEALLLILPGAVALAAGPFVAPGELSLRQDIQLLADYGIVTGPVTSWPLAWGPVLSDIERVEADRALPIPVTLALARVREQARRATRTRELQYRAALSAAGNPSRLRSFADTPRESGELGAGVSWIGDRLSVELNARAVASPDDGQEFRADGSMAGILAGNFSISAGTLDRWWGPGWDGSLILSSNARPIPALAIDRVFTEAFESRWLSWLGPWDLSVLFGRLESDRAVPGTRFFGFRLNFRPLSSLEIGLSRTAQWCGEGRPCDADTFFNLLAGRDNRGSEGIDGGNEPGNQLAGVDARWSASLFGRPLAVYGQFIGEDEAGGFPSRYLGMAGAETRGMWDDRWSYLAFAEVAGTSCDVVKDDIFDCAYNHGIYQTGYRYRGRAIGHTADGDSLLFSAGLVLGEPDGSKWWGILRAGDLNRGGAPDPRNSLTPTQQEVVSLDVYHSRLFRYGVVEVGAGIERVEDPVNDRTETDGRLFIRWQSSR